MNNQKKRAPRNRTTVLSDDDRELFMQSLVSFSSKASIDDVLGKTIHQDVHEVIPFLPQNSVDLLIVDPPYNMNKSFNGKAFTKKTLEEYEEWLDSWLAPIVPILKKTASLYICGDWQSSTAIHRVAQKYFTVRNRITWEREKGRGAKTNWKNCSEDIWFCTVSNQYTFNVDAVKMKRKVIAPYKNSDGTPKDWRKTDKGNFRITYPSNLWTDISIPFWSMPENTDHPTQKPEKLIAKLILASSNAEDVIFDPFLGSGTTSVVAKKLGRDYFGVEVDQDFCCLTQKRLSLVEAQPTIQGYTDGFFWERNSLAEQMKTNTSSLTSQHSEKQKSLSFGE